MRRFSIRNGEQVDDPEGPWAQFDGPEQEFLWRAERGWAIKGEVEQLRAALAALTVTACDAIACCGSEPEKMPEIIAARVALANHVK